MPVQIGIVGQIGNVMAIRNSYDRLGISSKILIEPHSRVMSDHTHLILPGVGSFSEGMARLRDSGWFDFITSTWGASGRPLMGICLGMQLLADVGYEGSVHGTKGLGLIPGEIVQMAGDSCYPLPHIGWNEVIHSGIAEIFKGIPSKTDFYFVHSYEFIAKESVAIVGKTEYKRLFVSAVCKENVIGVQFHPEKSQKVGERLLLNFASL